MESLLTQIKTLAANADNAGRKKIIQSLQELCYEIETPQDSMQRIIYLNLQLPLIRTGLDLKLFDILVENKAPMTVDQLAVKTGAAPTLLGRILRYLASIGTIKETAKDTFAANNITHALTIPGFQSGVYHNFDSLGPAFQALPDFLAETNYQDITDVTNTPLQKAWNTDLPAFLWMQTKPANHAHFNRFMTAHHMGMPVWLDVYPIEEKIQNLGANQPVFVDVGGGVGHQSVLLRERLPLSRVGNKVILEDLPATLQQAIQHDGVECAAQDFFQPQAIKGARMYYMRNIIHDYPDEKAVIILKNLAAVLGPDSLILIDDIVLPNSGAHLHATQLDMTMMSCLAAMERTTDQWYALIEKAGLRINKIFSYTTSLRDSIIECALA